MGRLAATPLTESGDEGLGRLLLRVARELRTLFDRNLETLGITAQQAGLLYRCSLSRELTPKQLTRLLITDNASVTRLADRLEAKGLLTRRTSSSDRRSVTLHITPSGRALLPRIRRLAEAEKQRIFDGLSPSDQERLRALLERILVNLEPTA